MLSRGFIPSLTTEQEQGLADQLFTHVDRIAGLIGPRHVGQPRAFQATADYIERQFVDLGYTVERQTYDAGECTADILVVELPGRRLADEIVVLGAHYDTIPETPGADDNASAVAMLLEVARLLQGVSFERTLRFIAFPCEERPHFYTGTMGSQVYARRCRARREVIVGMICLEMVGYYTTEERGQRIPPKIPRIFHWIFPRRGDFLAAVGNPRSWRLVWRFRKGFRRATRFPLFSIVLPESIPDIRRSDNSSFWDQRYPAIMVTDTSYLRNPNYHQPTDTPETLDYQRMARATLGVAGGVVELARACR